MKSKLKLPLDSIFMTNNGVAAMNISLQDSFEDQAITYARIVCIKQNSDDNNGILIATCDQHSWVLDEQVWPIYKSADSGKTWTHIADVKDTVFGTKRKAQPMLFELPKTIGKLKKGTLLLAGNLVPYDNSSSRLVIYKSDDLGETWTYFSTIDTGGAFEYDPSPESKTTTVWEPFLYIDGYDELVCAYSDERQKENGVLQALCLKHTNDGENWSDLINIVAVGNKNDRPGMVTVAKLPNNKYIATYEVVNRPSLEQNSSVVYYKFSDDGRTWNQDELGTLLLTEEGLGLGSSPYVKWVDTDGENGMIVVGSKWAIDKKGDISYGGQNFFVNYKLGEGEWEILPQALTWNGADIKYLDGFSQCIETNEDDSLIYQIANIVTPDETGIDLRVGSLPTNMVVYEAENALLTDCTVSECYDSSNGYEVSYINYDTSKILFNNILTATGGKHIVFVRYNNGTNETSTHIISVNDEDAFPLIYPKTADWNRYLWVAFECILQKGINTISIKYNGTYAEIDCIEIFKENL